MPRPIAALRELTPAELDKKIRDTRAELLSLRLRRETGQVERSHLLRAHRRTIARGIALAHQRARSGAAS